MIDLHCHLLPGIDDGAEDMQTALAMVRIAVDDGITHCVLTLHLHEGRWDNRAHHLVELCADFQQQLEAENIPLLVSYSTEVRIGPEILGWVAAGDINYLGKWQGDNVMLLELPHDQIPPGAEKLTAWLPVFPDS